MNSPKNTAAQPTPVPGGTVAQGEAGVRLHVRHSEWQTLSPEAQALLMDAGQRAVEKTREQERKNGTARANFPAVPLSATPAVPDTAPMYKALMFAQTALLPVGSGASIKALSLIDAVLNATPAAEGDAKDAKPDPFNSGSGDRGEVHAPGPTDAIREAIEEFDHQLTTWAKAYPLSVFPEPDMAKVHSLLQAEGMTLDAVSASNMRHVTSKLSELFEPVRAAILSTASPAGEVKV